MTAEELKEILRSLGDGGLDLSAVDLWMGNKDGSIGNYIETVRIVSSRRSDEETDSHIEFVDV